MQGGRRKKTNTQAGLLCLRQTHVYWWVQSAKQDTTAYDNHQGLHVIPIVVQTCYQFLSHHPKGTRNPSFLAPWGARDKPGDIYTTNEQGEKACFFCLCLQTTQAKTGTGKSGWWYRGGGAVYHKVYTIQRWQLFLAGSVATLPSASSTKLLIQSCIFEYKASDSNLHFLSANEEDEKKQKKGEDGGGQVITTPKLITGKKTDSSSCACKPPRLKVNWDWDSWVQWWYRDGGGVYHSGNHNKAHIIWKGQLLLVCSTYCPVYEVQSFLLAHKEGEGVCVCVCGGGGGGGQYG